LYGLGRGGPFARRWALGPIAADEVDQLAAQLEVEGARSYTQDQAGRLTTDALAALNAADPQGEAGLALRELADKLLLRTA
jgi:geranylgeranyl pyrophosphate synthase